MCDCGSQWHTVCWLIQSSITLVRGGAWFEALVSGTGACHWRALALGGLWRLVRVEGRHRRRHLHLVIFSNLQGLIRPMVQYREAGACGWRFMAHHGRRRLCTAPINDTYSHSRRIGNEGFSWRVPNEGSDSLHHQAPSLLDSPTVRNRKQPRCMAHGWEHRPQRQSVGSRLPAFVGTAPKDHPNPHGIPPPTGHYTSYGSCLWSLVASFCNPSRPGALSRVETRPM